MNLSGQPIEKLLTSRYGDGLIYIPKSMNSGVLQDAVSLGFVSEDGFLTRKGRNYLAKAKPVTSVGK